MSVPIVYSVAMRYPEHQFVFVARKMLAPMFFGLPNVHFETVDFAEKNHGLHGLIRLYTSLHHKYGHVDAVVDLQNVLRTFFVRTLYAVAGARVATIDYGRAEKRRILRHGMSDKPLKTTAQRYADTFAQLGLETDNSFEALPCNTMAAARVQANFGDKNGLWIGIAPFAKSKSNMLPFRTTKEIIEHFSQQANVRVFLFGAGEIESEMLHQWAIVFQGVVCVAGILPLDGELELMRRLDLMLCMDSANQHLASLVGLRALTVWGGTHPANGFSAWKQRSSDFLQNDTLRCRPCTINGARKCKHGDFACLRGMDAQRIIAASEAILNEKKQDEAIKIEK